MILQSGAHSAPLNPPSLRWLISTACPGWKQPNVMPQTGIYRTTELLGTPPALPHSLFHLLPAESVRLVRCLTEWRRCLTYSITHKCYSGTLCGVQHSLCVACSWGQERLDGFTPQRAPSSDNIDVTNTSSCACVSVVCVTMRHNASQCVTMQFFCLTMPVSISFNSCLCMSLSVYVSVSQFCFCPSLSSSDSLLLIVSASVLVVLSLQCSLFEQNFHFRSLVY